MRSLWLVAGLLYWILANFLAWRQGGLLPQDVALHYLRGLDCMEALRAGDIGKFLGVFLQALPNPGFLGGWIGLWMALLGASPQVAIASLLPWHLLLAWGLWKGGDALGGRWGGSAALVLGLMQPVGLQQAMSIHPDLLLFAGTAGLGGAILGGGRAGAWALGLAAAGKVATLPSLAGMMVDAAVQKIRSREWKNLIGLFTPLMIVGLLWYLPHVGQLQDYAGGSERISAAFRGTEAIGARFSAGIQNLLRVTGPAAPLATVLALLLRRDGASIRPLGWALATLLGMALVEHQPQERYVLPALVSLCFAAAALATVGRGPLLLGACLLLHLGFQARAVPWAPLLKPTPTYDLDGVLDWLAGAARRNGVARPKVAVLVEPGGALSGPAWVIRARERNLNMDFLVVEEQQPLAEVSDLGLIVDLPTLEQREGWRALLPPPAEHHAWPGDYHLFLWDRGLPPEDSSGDVRDHHPAGQALYALLPNGTVSAPLLQPASSVVVVEGRPWVALFVREQQLWRAESTDGLSWQAPEKLGIFGFDPEVVRTETGWRVFYVEAESPQADPALSKTRIRSLSSPDLRHFQPEAGVRLAGEGLVDPALYRTAEGWELYLTEQGSRLRRALSTDGLTFSLDPAFLLKGSTVPAVAGTSLIVQRQVGAESSFYLLERAEKGWIRPQPLELCGTGASVAGGRLYYTRDAQRAPCAPPIVYPDRRKPQKL
jgi:hypothetical protein